MKTFETYSLEQILQKNIYREFHLETHVEINITVISETETALSADIVYARPIRRSLAEEITRYVNDYFDRSPHRN